MGINRREKKAKIWDKVIDTKSLLNAQSFNFYNHNECNITAMNIVNSIMNWHHTLTRLIIQCNLNDKSYQSQVTVESLACEMLHTFLSRGSYTPIRRGIYGTFNQLQDVDIIISYNYCNSEEHEKVSAVLNKILETIDKEYVPRVIELQNIQNFRLKFVLNETTNTTCTMVSRDTRKKALVKDSAELFGKQVKDILKNNNVKTYSCSCSTLYSKRK